MDRFESFIEKTIREAIEAGEFDNLPGKGQPVDLRENPFEDPDLRMVHKLLKDAGFAPAWIEERKDIEATFAVAHQKLARAWAIYKPGGITPDEMAWRRNVAEFRDLVAELNNRIKLYNLKAPASLFHRRQFVANRVINDIVAAADLAE